ncbi:MAG: 7TM diverse intracellular signaling domain-containing protein [Rheinheimera sp.]|nr:7TM diverse intracellular signaling domain-containing protein [Rheinheimera sp.]
MLLSACTEAIAVPESLQQSLAAAAGRSEFISLQVQTAGPAVLALGVPDVQRLRLYQWRQGQWQLIFSQDPGQPFGSRLLATPRLAVPLELSRGEHQFYLNYYIHANGRLQPVLYQPDAWARSQLWQQLLSGVLLGVMLAMLLLALLYRSVSDQAAYWAYCLLVLGHVAILPQIEGYYFQLLWPDVPQLNQLLPLLLSSLVIGSHALFAFVFFRLPQRYPTLTLAHRLVLVLLLLNLLAGSLLPGDGKRFYDELLVLVLIAFVYSILAVLTAIRTHRDQLAGATLYLLGTVSLMVCTMLLMGLGVLGLNPFPFIDFFHYPKIGFLLETSFFSAALISKMWQFRQQQTEQRLHRLAEAAQLAQAEQERRYAQARAADSALRLATASHDISQPLASLRFAIDVLKQQQAQQPLAEHIDRTIQYAQTLLSDIMQECKQSHQPGEAVQLGALFNLLAAEYRPIAAQKGLQLRVVSSQLTLDTSFVVLSRILHNLLANAIRYSHSGTVLIGVRRRPQALEIQVLDRGPGLLPEQLQRLQQAFVQGDNARSGSGVGLGLYIVQTLCAQLGYRLQVHSVLRRGSCFSILIPQAANKEFS